jgi:hypothetical protein
VPTVPTVPTVLAATMPAGAPRTSSTSPTRSRQATGRSG